MGSDKQEQNGGCPGPRAVVVRVLRDSCLERGSGCHQELMMVVGLTNPAASSRPRSHSQKVVAPVISLKERQRLTAADVTKYCCQFNSCCRISRWGVGVCACDSEQVTRRATPT